MKNILEFGKRLKELMFYEGEIKSEKLGEAIGVSGQTIRAWCDGKQYIFLSNLLRLADFFHCSLDFLAGRSDVLLDYMPQECPPFYERLRYVMRERCVSRYRMDKDTKIKDSYFTEWSRGTDPHILSLIEAAEYLDVSIDYLVGREK